MTAPVAVRMAGVVPQPASDKVASDTMTILRISSLRAVHSETAGKLLG
jgi:hypothetical protein